MPSKAYAILTVIVVLLVVIVGLTLSRRANTNVAPVTESNKLLKAELETNE